MTDQQSVWMMSRREFLQGLAAAGVLAGLAPRAVAEAMAGETRFGGLPLDEGLIRQLLTRAMARGGEFAEVYAQDALVNSVRLDESKIRSASVGAMRGVGVRVIKGIKVGYAYSDDFSPQALWRTADTAALIAGGAGSWTPHPLEPRMAQPLSPIRLNCSDVPVRQKVEMMLAIDETARAYDRRVTQVMAALDDATNYRLVANTEGLLAEDRDVMVRLAANVIACDGSDRRVGFFGGGGRVGFEYYETFTPVDVAKRAAQIAVSMLGAVDAPAGEQTVVLANGWSGILLHEAIGHGLEADFIRKATSLYTGKVGQRVAGEQCTVIDDATLPNKRGTFNMDDEGSPPRRKVLIENGILRGYMSDRLNAKLLDPQAQSTGNGRRESFRFLPIPRMSNTFLAPGQASPEDIIKSVKKGLYAKMFGGGQVDIANGNFVFEVAEGYLIEDGQITKPVKGAMLIGVGPVALQNVTMVGADAALDPGIGTCGKDGQGVPVGVGLPHVRIDKITVGGTRA